MDAIQAALRAMKPCVKMLWSSEDQWNKAFSVGEFDVAPYWSGGAMRSIRRTSCPSPTSSPRKAALYRGRYPDDVLAAYRAHGATLCVTPEQWLLREARPDFLGVNFYAQAQVRADPVPACNGPLRPAALRDLLLRLHTEVDGPRMMITENGAGCIGHGDTPDAARRGRDAERGDYITRHIDAVLAARQDGALVDGYCLWSLCDNFEWFWGTSSRLGIVHVDMATRRRTPKHRFAVYAALIARGGT